MARVRAKRFSCPICKKGIKTSVGVSRHIAQTKCAREANGRSVPHLDTPGPTPLGSFPRPSWLVPPLLFSPAPGNSPQLDQPQPSDHPLPSDPFDPPEFVPSHFSPSSPAPPSSPPQPASASSLFVEQLPESFEAGKTYGRGSPTFILQQEALSQSKSKSNSKRSAFYPFRDKDEWELAKFLIQSGMRATAVDRLLKQPSVRKRMRLSFINIKQLREKIRKLPKLPEFKRYTVKVPGENGAFEEVEMFHRNALDLVRHLIGNPAFNGEMSYTPKKFYSSSTKTTRYYTEMWTGDWWWETQMTLDTGTTLVPIIISSDKTKLSRFTGDKTAWPVYLSIGNLSSPARRAPSRHGTLLLGYLPITKLDHLFNSDKRRAVEQKNLFHRCLSKMLESLSSKELSTNGVEAVCADGYVRKIFPVVATYIADFPEQCLVACCQENYCPICTVNWRERGVLKEHEMRDPAATLAALDNHRRGSKNAEDRRRFLAEGLRPMDSPFWADLPHCNIFNAVTPDLLHQIHKGVFHSHLFAWCRDAIPDQELDRRFRALPLHSSLRHFKKGITGISQWTGSEHKAVEKVFLGVVGDLLSTEAMRAARAMLDFIMLAQYPIHSTETLATMRSALEVFHRFKEHLTDREEFNIPKLHVISHYFNSIMSLGAATGYNTEGPERLHIEFAKKAYDASNKKEYLPQMIDWLERREAIMLKDAYLRGLSPIVACDEIMKSIHDNSESSDGSTSDEEDSDYAEGDDLTDDSDTTSDDSSPDEVGGDDRDGHIIISLPSSFITAPSTPFPLPASPAATLPISAAMAKYVCPDITRLLERDFAEILPTPATTLQIFHMARLRVKASVYQEGSFIDVLRAHPATRRRGSTAPKPAHYSTVLVHKTLAPLPQDLDPSVKDLRVAQIRLIFRPKSSVTQDSTPLVYIELFHTFDHGQTSHGHHWEVSRKRRKSGSRHSTIVPLTAIYRSCHLLPQFSSKVVKSLKPEDIPERCSTFYVNDTLDLHSYSLLR